MLPLPHTYGKINAAQISAYMDTFLSDESHEHMVMPGMVYISQPTEYGTLYSLEELTALSETCRKYHLPLYADGARLAYALASPENDVTLKDLARLFSAEYRTVLADSLVSHVTVLINVLAVAYTAKTGTDSARHLFFQRDIAFDSVLHCIGF